MAAATDYQIDCTTKSTHTSPQGYTHGHIVSVGIGDERTMTQRMTIPQVYALMAKGDRFFTRSPTTGKWALVEPWTCCYVSTLRTVADGVVDNNLDSLPTCPA